MSGSIIGVIEGDSRSVDYRLTWFRVDGLVFRVWGIVFEDLSSRVFPILDTPGAVGAYVSCKEMREGCCRNSPRKQVGAWKSTVFC